jgi:mono/diheme cytochrome c family protein
MSPKVRWLLLGLAALSLTAAAVNESGMLMRPPSPIVVTPDLVAAGRKVYLARCHTCHSDVPLAKRVKDWEPMHAYDVIGRLPEVLKGGKKPMPAFPGTDEDRRALAAWVSELGAGRVPQY